jgi:trehalose-phosphatase
LFVPQQLVIQTSFNFLGLLGACVRGRTRTGGRFAVRQRWLERAERGVPRRPAVIRAGAPPAVTSPGAGTPERFVSTAAEVDAAFRALIDAPPPLSLVIDFDGTLAVGSRDPAVARIEPLAQRALRRLARIADARPARLRLAVLTGRVVADVAARIRVGGIDYLGDHGLEHACLPRHGRAERLIVASDRAFDVHRDAAETLATAVAEELGSPAWLFVERKGPSVAFHVRQADDIPAARAAVVSAIEAVERRTGLVHDLAHYRGRSVVDLRPREAGGKREAVERLIARDRPGAIAVLGDELSDIDAFEAVIAARGSGRDGAPPLVGVTVAVHGSARPAPAGLLAVADLRLGGAHEVGRWLAALARHLEAEGRGTG